ncbi:MAG: heparinase II/III family protein [Planctomycetes bacterium]|nr:heparinase II/III family protein [Planctomycetota bacterium]
MIRERWDRDGLRDSLHCYFTAAFNTRTHKHHDDMSFTIFGFGREILTDAGRHSYNYTDPHRRYCESVYGHNVVIVDRADTDTRRLNIGKSGITSAFTGKGVTGVDAVHYLYPGVESRRLLVFFPPHVFVVFDRLVCDREISATQQFLFAPDWRVAPDDAHAGLLRATLAEHSADSPTVFMSQLMPGTAASRVISGQRDPLVGWVSRQHGSFESASAVHSDAAGQSVAFVTAFVFQGPGEAERIPVGRSEWDGSTLQCALSVGGQSHDFTFETGPVRSRIRFRESAIESSVWPTPFEYRSRRSLARSPISNVSGETGKIHKREANGDLRLV